MVRIKTCRLTRNPQLGDPVAWLNLTLADGRELDDVAPHRSPGGRWFFQGWGWVSAELAAMVGRAIHRAATARDDRLARDRARSRRAAGEAGIKGETDGGDGEQADKTGPQRRSPEGADPPSSSLRSERRRPATCSALSSRIAKSR